MRVSSGKDDLILRVPYTHSVFKERPLPSQSRKAPSVRVPIPIRADLVLLPYRNVPGSQGPPSRRGILSEIRPRPIQDGFTHPRYGAYDGGSYSVMPEPQRGMGHAASAQPPPLRRSLVPAYNPPYSAQSSDGHRTSSPNRGPYPLGIARQQSPATVIASSSQFQFQGLAGNQSAAGGSDYSQVYLKSYSFSFEAVYN